MHQNTTKITRQKPTMILAEPVIMEQNFPPFPCDGQWNHESGFDVGTANEHEVLRGSPHRKTFPT